MKKLFAVLLFLSSPGWASYFPLSISTGSAAVPIGSTIAITNAVGSQITVVSTGVPITIAAPVVVTGSTVGIVGTAPLVVTGSTIGIVSPSGTYLLTAQEVIATSVTLPTAAASASSMTMRADSLGRTMVTGMPYGVISTTWSINISTGTGEILMISSPTAPTRTFLCGCVFKSTSPTNTGVTLYDKTAVNANAAFAIGIPGNYAVSMIWPGCSQPFFWSSAGSQITMKADVSATATQMFCQYYQSQ